MNRDAGTDFITLGEERSPDFIKENEYESACTHINKKIDLIQKSDQLKLQLCNSMSYFIGSPILFEKKECVKILLLEKRV